MSIHQPRMCVTYWCIHVILLEPRTVFAMDAAAIDHKENPSRPEEVRQLVKERQSVLDPNRNAPHVN